jgi:hypothetical protein
LPAARKDFEGIMAHVPDAAQRLLAVHRRAGSYQTPAFCTAPALQRSATRCAASGERGWPGRRAFARLRAKGSPP